MHQILQWFGGGFYLLNKIFLSFSEHAYKNETKARQWEVASWLVYLAGLPPWVIIFIGNRNWIAASVEACGLPAMIVGLVSSLSRGKSEDKTPRWLIRLSVAFVMIGLGISMRDLGGLYLFTQWLEIGLAAGFLVGTLLLARKKVSGYLWFVLMHISCAWLMKIEGRELLFYMQLISLVFILDAYLMTRRQKKNLPVV